MKGFVGSLGGNHTGAGMRADAVVNADLVIRTPASNVKSAGESGWLAR